MDTAANEIAITELRTNKRLTIKLTADSQLKKMPGFPAMGGGGMPPGGPPGGPGAPRTAGRPDISQMLERMPAARLGELKPGEAVVISSTKGARNGELTAIMLLANADLLIRMATAAEAGNGWPEAMGQAPGIMGIQGLELPGIMP